MVFSGTTFLGARYTALPTPVFSSSETYVALQNGSFDGFEILSEVVSNPSPNLSERWTWNTVMKADFSTGKTMAGNTDWTLETVSRVVIKKRIKGDFVWQTVEVHDVNSIEDFNFHGIDRYNKAKVYYEYAIVPYLGNNAGMYNTEEVESNFDAVFIVGANEAYKTFSTTAYLDTTRNISGNYNVPSNSRYPTFYHSGLMNFDSGSCDGKFYDLDESCSIVDDYGYFFKEKLMNFLTDGNPKILKHPDGRIWLIQVIPSPTDSADGEYFLRNIAFSWIQIGRYDNNEDLYRAGLIDLSEEWWNN